MNYLCPEEMNCAACKPRWELWWQENDKSESIQSDPENGTYFRGGKL
jgi:hypothetical protein